MTIHEMTRRDIIDDLVASETSWSGRLEEALVRPF